MTKLRDYVSRPWLKVMLGLAIALVLAVLVVLVFDGEREKYLLIYDIPIVIPFVMFVIDRITNLNGINNAGNALDIAVLALSVSRAFIRVPLVSGHAIFLT